MHILITGGTGFIGRNVMTDFLKRGSETSFAALVHPGGSIPAKHGSFPPEKVTYLRDLREIKNRPDVLIHLAGSPVFRMRPFFENIGEIRESRGTYTKKLLRGLAGMGLLPDTIIMAGSTGFYPPSRIPAPENAPPGTTFPALLAQEWENAASETLGELVRDGIIPRLPRLITLRFSTVMGRDGGFLKPFMLMKRAPALIPGAGDYWISWISIQDTAEIIWKMIQEWPNFAGAVNLAVPKPLSVNEICREIARINRGIFTFHIPAGLIRLMKPKTADFILLSNTARPEVLTDKLGYRFLWEDFGVFLNSL